MHNVHKLVAITRAFTEVDLLFLFANKTNNYLPGVFSSITRNVMLIISLCSGWSGREKNKRKKVDNSKSK